MFDLAYDFIRNYLIGETTAMSSAMADELAIFMTVIFIVVAFMLLWRLIRWTFGVFSGGRFWGR